MVRRVYMSAAVGYNLFDTQRLTIGWVNEMEEDPTPSFYTSDFIPVSRGDMLYFGAAVASQWWHLVAYDAEKTPLYRGMMSNGVSFHQRLDAETAIFNYRVEAGVSFVRMICDNRHAHAYLVTKNRPFSADDYRALMTSPDMKPLTHMETCVNDEWTIILNFQGSGTMTVGGRVYTYGPQTLTAVPPGMPVCKDSEEGFWDLHVCGDEFAPAALTGGKPIVTTDDDNRSIETLMRLMLRLYWDSAAHNRRLLEQLYGLVEQFVLHRLEMEQPQHSCVTHLYNTLLLRFSDPELSLEELFVGEHYCPNHLRRLFKEKMGCSPKECLMELRIRHAQTLMQENRNLKNSIAQIALLSGFRDPCYFSRAFKRRVGCSPAEFMKNGDAIYT